MDIFARNYVFNYQEDEKGLTITGKNRQIFRSCCEEYQWMVRMVKFQVGGFLSFHKAKNEIFCGLHAVAHYLILYSVCAMKPSLCLSQRYITKVDL